MPNKIRFTYSKVLLITLLLPAMLMLCVPLFAQRDTVIKLRFSITDAYTKLGVKGATVVNRTNGTVAITDTNGYTETKANPHDLLYIVATGYHALPVSVADSVGKQSCFLHLVIEPFSAGINQPVIITGNKTLDNIGQDKQRMGYVPPELKKPKIPIPDVMGLLYDRVGARGKEREELKKEMAGDDRWKVMSEYLNYCNEKQLINLPQESYNDFINYCNLSIAYLKSHADYEILTAISNKFQQYSKERGLVK